MSSSNYNWFRSLQDNAHVFQHEELHQTSNNFHSPEPTHLCEYVEEKVKKLHNDWNPLQLIISTFVLITIIVVIFQSKSVLVLMHCPGKKSDYREKKCDPQVQKDYEYKRIFTLMKIIARRRIPIAKWWPDRLLVTDNGNDIDLNSALRKEKQLFAIWWFNYALKAIKTKVGARNINECNFANDQESLINSTETLDEDSRKVSVYEGKQKSGSISVISSTFEVPDQWKQKPSSFKDPTSVWTRQYKQEDVVKDGSVYDRARDPPGQRSVYIPPGDSCKESYRLSTYIKFPENVPVIPRHLASSGFFYTGYKDRVKCFSCGLCVENWVFGDDVQSVRWHRNDCQFIKGQECGNIPIGGGGLARFMTPVRRQQTGGEMAMETGPLQAANNQTATTTSATQQRLPARAPSAGDVLKQPASHSSSTPAQTARPIQPPRQTASVLQTVELATIPSAYHEHFVRSLDLRKEAERVRTFEHWPTEQPTVFPNDLAKSGFFYLGNLDRVQCFSCGGVLRNWNYGDNVNAEHRRHFPHCKMVQNTETRNIPLTAEQRAALPNQQLVFTEPPDPSEAEARDLREMFPCQYPVSPHMRNEDTRFETFDHRWPSSQVHASPRDIARSGFFFLGDRDRVKCWYCNGGLQNWDPDDEPWTEHAKWFPTCEFLLRRKGPDFVHRMVSMFPNLPRPLLRGPFDVPPNDPGRRIAYGTNSSRAPSPPPAIIDPQAELQKERTRLEEAMKSSFVKTAVEMGFERKIVKHVVKKQINRSSMFASVPELIDALTLNTSDASDSEDEKDTKKAASANKRDTTEALQGHYSGQAIPARVEEAAAASSAMETEDVSPSMEARIKELQEERNCKICLDKPADIVFVPCGHLCSCRDCAAALRKCPMCRTKIERAIRTYMS